MKLESISVLCPVLSIRLYAFTEFLDLMLLWTNAFRVPASTVLLVLTLCNSQGFLEKQNHLDGWIDRQMRGN